METEADTIGTIGDTRIILTTNDVDNAILQFVNDDGPGNRRGFNNHFNSVASL